MMLLDFDEVPPCDRREDPDLRIEGRRLGTGEGGAAREGWISDMDERDECKPDGVAGVKLPELRGETRGVSILAPDPAVVALMTCWVGVATVEVLVGDNNELAADVSIPSGKGRVDAIAAALVCAIGCCWVCCDGWTCWVCC